MPRISIVVSFALPEGATKEDALEYVKDAVTCYCGSLRPPQSEGVFDEGDPMFPLDRDSVKVRERK